MGILFAFRIKNSALVNLVDANSAAGMNDGILIDEHAYVSDLVIISKESKIARQALAQKVNGFTLCGLLAGIAQQAYLLHFKNHLSKSAAVDAERAFPAPTVGGVEVLSGCLNKKCGVFLETGIGNPSADGKRFFVKFHHHAVELWQGTADEYGYLPFLTYGRLQNIVAAGVYFFTVVFKVDAIVPGKLSGKDPAFVPVEAAFNMRPFLMLVNDLEAVAKKQFRYLLTPVRRFFPHGYTREVADSV